MQLSMSEIKAKLSYAAMWNLVTDRPIEVNDLDEYFIVYIVDLKIVERGKAGRLEFSDPMFRDYCAIDALIVEMIKGDYGSDTFDAIATHLARLNSPKTIQALMQAADNENPRMRYAAIRGLGESRNYSAIETLRQKTTLGDLYARRLAIRSLNKIAWASETAIKALVDLMKQGDEDYAHFAADDLIEIGKPAVPFLVATLNSENEFVRRVISYTLSEIGDQECLRAILSLLDDKYPDVRAVAKRHLDKFDRKLFELAVKKM